MIDFPAVSGIVLSGGASSRMGRPKALLPWGEGTFLSTLLGCLAGLCEQVVVVAGVHAPEIEAYLDSMTGQPIRLVRNPQPDRGQFSSLQLGLRAIGSATDGVLFTPCDLPLTSADVPRQLVHAFGMDDTPHASMFVPVWREVTGHPVLIGRKLADGLSQLDPRAHTRDALQQVRMELGGKRLLVPVDEPAIIKNINTIRDYQSLTGGEQDV